MLPIVLDPARVAVVLVGNGGAAARRLALLESSGVANLTIYAPEPSEELAAAAGSRLRRRLPSPREFMRARSLALAQKQQCAPRLREPCTRLPHCRRRLEHAYRGIGVAPLKRAPQLENPDPE